MIRRLARVAGATLVLGAAATAMAQPPEPSQPLETRLEARKVARTPDGSERYSSADSARPGEVVEYMATYRNTGKQLIKNVEATLPIPPGTEFIPGSAKPGPDKVSADGVTYSPPPLMRKVSRDGKEVTEQVVPRDYRFLRWFVGAMSAEQSVSYSARVRVLGER